MKRPAALLLWFLLSVSFVLSQTAIVKRNVNLRSVPSTVGAPIVKVVPPAQLELLDPNPTNGFYHVKAGQNEGWVWGRNISIQLGDQPPTTTQPPPTAGAGSLIESNPLSEISSSWEKETPSDTVFHSDEGDCAETGDGGDADTNKLKNRVDEQGENVAVIVETTPRLRQQHPNWTVSRLKPWTESVGSRANAAFNGQSVRIRGWLMLDPEHRDMINHGLRSTLWEIHPITQIEVFQGGQWVDLDTLP